jgi:uncharacterized membrane protein YgdD (TMEM256/DUF423 family)
MNKRFLQLGALLGCLSVALGAFAAHGLKKILTPEELTVFETGVRYQFYHVFALLAAGLLAKWFHPVRCRWAAVFFLAGIVLFSGSLYLMSFAKANHWEALTSLGWITPVGGLFLMAGWVLLFLALSKESTSSGKDGW